MEARAFEPWDYPMIAEWYRSQMEPCPPIDLLPKNGFIVEVITFDFRNENALKVFTIFQGSRYFNNYKIICFH